jgi:hypothetical protein
MWTVAGDMTGPIFTAGRLKNEYRAAMAQRDQAQISFEKLVTQAFGEVSNSLSAHDKLAKAFQEQATCVDAYRESVRLSTARYDSGLSSYLEVVDAQIQLYPAESPGITYDLRAKTCPCRSLPRLGRRMEFVRSRLEEQDRYAGRVHNTTEALTLITSAESSSRRGCGSLCRSNGRDWT